MSNWTKKETRKDLNPKQRKLHNSEIISGATQHNIKGMLIGSRPSERKLKLLSRAI